MSGSARPARGSAARRGWRLDAMSLSIACHLLIVFALLSMRTPPPIAAPSRPVLVTLVDEQHPAPKPSPAPTHALTAAAKTPDRTTASKPARAPEHPAATQPAPRRNAPRPAPADAETPATEAASGSGIGLSDADVAGAATAGSRSGAGACDMASWLQSALRKDPLVQAAAAGAGRTGGRNIMVWNGDWVRSGGEDGKGLAAVREAILWGVAFAPQACRGQTVRGLVLLSLNETPGAPRFVLGSETWRWTDLLNPRAGVPDEDGR